MASLAARRMFSFRPISSSVSQSAAKYHSYSAAVSHSVFQMKEGVHSNTYMEGVNKVFPEIRSLPGFAPKGFATVGAFCSCPLAFVGMNVWESVDAANEAGKNLGPILAKFADYVDVSNMQRNVYECHIVDYGKLPSSSEFQKVAMSSQEIQMKPGTAKPLMEEMLKKYDMGEKLKEMGLDVYMQILIYPNEHSVISHAIAKDTTPFTSFWADAARQQKLGALYKEFGITDVMTGPPQGRVLYPDAITYKD